MSGDVYVEYDSNNSGGEWWLNDDQWRALEKAGWDVEWVSEQQNRFLSDSDRFLGALATKATRHGLPLEDAAQEWESVTGECSTDAGCPCCGNPHSFSEHDESGRVLRMGPATEYVARW